MNSDTALLLLLVISVVMSAIGAPLAFALREELERAKGKVANYAALGLLSLVCQWSMLGLWWYYATQTNQILLAVIPTVAIVWGWILRAAMRATRP